MLVFGHRRARTFRLPVVERGFAIPFSVHRSAVFILASSLVDALLDDASEPNRKATPSSHGIAIECNDFSLWPPKTYSHRSQFDPSFGL